MAKGRRPKGRTGPPVDEKKPSTFVIGDHNRKPGAAKSKRERIHRRARRSGARVLRAWAAVWEMEPKP